MRSDSPNAAATSDSALVFQAQMLQRVSRTYAMTIPRLPPGLRETVANAYLLCRIADIIEDEPSFDASRKQALLGDFLAAAAGQGDADAHAAKLSRLLSGATPSSERELAASFGRIAAVTRGFSPAQQQAIARCLKTMAVGMTEFQRRDASKGLASMAELDRYCYHVAGVVAEMLVELFGEHAATIKERRSALLALAPSYGQGLQMTNILHDIWSDLGQGVCWLPRERFCCQDLAALVTDDRRPGFSAALDELFKAASEHLWRGLDFVLLIPRRETGIRRHLLLTLALAASNLHHLHRSPDFRAGQSIAPPRGAIALGVASHALAGADCCARMLLRVLLRDFPAPG